jgi:hypothetical protein
MVNQSVRMENFMKFCLTIFAALQVMSSSAAFFLFTFDKSPDDNGTNGTYICYFQSVHETNPVAMSPFASGNTNSFDFDSTGFPNPCFLYAKFLRSDDGVVSLASVPLYFDTNPPTVFITNTVTIISNPPPVVLPEPPSNHRITPLHP